MLGPGDPKTAPNKKNVSKTIGPPMMEPCVGLAFDSWVSARIRLGIDVPDRNIFRVVMFQGESF